MLLQLDAIKQYLVSWNNQMFQEIIEEDIENRLNRHY